jgi:4a-hydroxytetrahydrobiopterin dehydratase
MRRDSSAVEIPMKLSHSEAEQRLKGTAGWTLDGDAIRKQFTFANFPEAIAFVNRLAPEAEAADHHPDILINYKRVTLTYSTHSEGGLTVKDFAGAAAADRLANKITRLPNEIEEDL